MLFRTFSKKAALLITEVKSMTANSLICIFMYNSEQLEIGIAIQKSYVLTIIHLQKRPYMYFSP